MSLSFRTFAPVGSSDDPMGGQSIEPKLYPADEDIRGLALLGLISGLVSGTSQDWSASDKSSSSCESVYDRSTSDDSEGGRERSRI